ncbi:HNH endonuclease [Bacillus phage vB_BanS_Skywalker]|uniref:HNH endonuclease n=2 Tax=Tsamsavirus TaxID=3044849 RepID=A0AAE8YYN5_9CAUD|nr:HNH endonuclease [Bacillus phage vB_BanS_Skywalker]YP_010680972.1 HNH endonuclease [Bacillus phage vB_BanS_MrDarsey]UGO47908.1 HNH endonuclease [Bacillus phage vB_BanS_MrDarsey]UGO51349.1 HNH endonuclease [Bacillus phage vB_BanS_Skywalker]
MKQIKGYEGKYSVSKDGNVYSEKSKKFLKQQINHRGYSCVNLYDKYGKMKTHTVHRLVALAFISNPENKPEINHRDGNKQNNDSDNLEWSTRSENMIHAHENGLQPKSEKQSEHARNLMLQTNIKKRKPVLQFDLNMNLIAEHDSIVDASLLFGSKNYVSDISKCCRDKKKSCKGFIWKYKS